MVIGFAFWAVGLIEFDYVSNVSDQPLLNPQKVREFSGTNMVLESGEIIALVPRYSSAPTAEAYWSISNQVSRSEFEVDIEPQDGGHVEIYVRRHRKFRDTVPPFTIPLVPVSKYIRKAVAWGTFLSANSQLGNKGSADGDQPVRPGINAPPL